jgi:hypothetical protein
VTEHPRLIVAGSMWIRRIKRPECMLRAMAAGVILVDAKQGVLGFRLVAEPKPLPPDVEDE